MADDIKMLGALSLGLLALMIILGLVFVVGNQFQKTICEDIDGETFQSGSCVTTANTSIESQSRAFNNTGDVVTAIELVVSFLTIIVLILITKLLIANVKGINGGEN